MTPPPLLLLLLLLLLFPMAIPRYFFLIALSLSLSATAPVASSSSTADTDLRSKSLILVKIGCLILLFVGTFAAAVSPYFLKWNEAFLLLGTQFAGGVFLGAALMHFLRDANHTFEGITSAHYPFAFMLASAGYLLTMLADCVISYMYAKQSPPAGDLELQGDGQHKNNSHNNTLHSSSQVQPTNATVRSFGDTILLISALCFHSFFEGMAIGVAETKSNAWKTLWTICLHKIFAAVAMGIALLRMTPNRPLFSCVAYGFAFAISSPVGVAVGLTIDATAQGAVADWIFAISMGLTCGIFIFISINHLISKGYVPSKQVSVDTAHHKLLAVLLGVGTISVVLIWDT